MAIRPSRFLPLCIALLAGALVPAHAHAGGPEAETFNTGAGNLIAVLRESGGANKQDETLKPLGKLRATLADGRVMDVDISWFGYLGDMHLRLVFDGVQNMQSASPEDLERLRLSPEEALRLAVANLRRAYGPPQAEPWSGGLTQVRGTSPDLDSSWFLDREFWQEQQRPHPQGLVVAVPQRGGLVYAPADDADAVEGLRFSAAAMYAGGTRSRVSSALYLFKDGHWSVFQAPLDLRPAQ
ncbi:MAG: hypothetical protein HYX47_02440 [Burkholderiales bacterium]|nr:hypothetical protein [Burkholderiales bacterium]